MLFTARQGSSPVKVLPEKPGIHYKIKQIAGPDDLPSFSSFQFMQAGGPSPPRPVFLNDRPGTVPVPDPAVPAGISSGRSYGRVAGSARPYKEAKYQKKGLLILLEYWYF
jgi:hypothetical protein